MMSCTGKSWPTLILALSECRGSPAALRGLLVPDRAGFPVIHITVFILRAVIFHVCLPTSCNVCLTQAHELHGVHLAIFAAPLSTSFITSLGLTVPRWLSPPCVHTFHPCIHNDSWMLLPFCAAHLIISSLISCDQGCSLNLDCIRVHIYI